MNNIHEITGFSVISTNNDRNVLNDVTRDDLIDILKQIMTESKCDKITPIIEDIIAHTGYNGDPHEVKIDQLVESVLERVYNYWLNYGFSGSYDYFKDSIFKYYKSCTNFSLLLGKKVDIITSVRDVFNAILDHDTTVTDFNNINIFSFSEKDRKWDGLYSGVRFQTDGSLKYAPDTEPTIEFNSNGEPWYKWELEIPKKLRYSKISLNVYADNPNYTIMYRLSTDEQWSVMPTSITVPNELPDISDNTFDMRKEELLTYQFKIEFNTTPFILQDIVTVIDTSMSITDDPTLMTIYRDIPHTEAWDKYFSIGKPSTDVFGWYANINPNYIKDTDVSWLPQQCTFEIAAQAHQNRLLINDKKYPGSLLVSDFIIASDNNQYIFEIYTQIIGGFTSPIPSITNMSALSNVYIGIRIKNNGEIIDKLTTSDLAKSNRALYRFMVSCDFDTNTFTIWYIDENGLTSVSKTSITNANFKNIQSWKILNPADFTRNSFIGLHEFICYNDNSPDLQFINTMIMTDISDRPYVPIETIETTGNVITVTNNYFGFEESNYEPFDTNPFHK